MQLLTACSPQEEVRREALKQRAEQSVHREEPGWEEEEGKSDGREAEGELLRPVVDLGRRKGAVEWFLLTSSPVQLQYPHGMCLYSALWPKAANAAGSPSRGEVNAPDIAVLSRSALNRAGEKAQWLQLCVWLLSPWFQCASQTWMVDLYRSPVGRGSIILMLQIGKPKHRETKRHAQDQTGSLGMELGIEADLLCALAPSWACCSGLCLDQALTGRKLSGAPPQGGQADNGRTC